MNKNGSFVPPPIATGELIRRMLVDRVDERRLSVGMVIGTTESKSHQVISCDRAIADGANPNDIVGTFRKHRAIIERIASEQYDDGKEMPAVWAGRRRSPDEPTPSLRMIPVPNRRSTTTSATGS